MRKIEFAKMVASGNDFVVVAPLRRCAIAPLKKLAQKLCNRKYGVGADGLLVLEKSKIAEVGMRIFNADGSEAEMCGNGARCAALYLGKKKVSMETKAGVIRSEIKNNNVRIKLTDPKNIKLDIPIKVINRNLRVNLINTGVPHAVIFVEGLDEIHVGQIGRAVRYHKKFSPAGTNVDFVEVLSENLIAVRTYERGVEDETLACGTGAAAAALITAYGLELRACAIKVHTKGGEILTVYFKRGDNEAPLRRGRGGFPERNTERPLFIRTLKGAVFWPRMYKFKDVWLEGKAKIVYKGVYNV